jgi:hypothetical protein
VVAQLRTALAEKTTALKAYTDAAARAETVLSQAWPRL